jgi:uncharacterized membrane protein
MGDIITYRVTITNTGNAPDTFDVALNSSNGWARALEEIGPLSRASSATLTVTVSIPAGTALNSETTRLTLSSQGDLLQKYVVTLITTVAERKVYMPLLNRKQ